MKYYKLGCSNNSLVTVNSRSKVERIRETDIGASLLDLPEPIPTLLLYFMITFGAIALVKAGIL